MTVDEVKKLKPLDRVRHKIFGVGYVVDHHRFGMDGTVRVHFEDHDTKELMLDFAAPRLERC